MTQAQGSVRRQRGVAMIVALLMTATLSFLALGISEAMRISARRTGFAIDRADLQWRAVSAEAIARAALRQLQATSGPDGEPQRLLLTSPLFLAPVDVPLPDGKASLQLSDASRCFNLNSLPGIEGEGGPEKMAGEFVALAASLGLQDGAAQRLAAVILDWIDVDDTVSIGGAEDDFYTALPSPYRTGGGLLADVSEMRAMLGADRITYEGLRPFICALPDPGPVSLNVNMLRPRDLPLLAAIIEGATETRVNPAELGAVLDARPPEGWANAGQFWADPTLAGFEVPEPVRQNRTDVASRFIKARAVIERGDARVVVNMMFRSEQGSGYSLVSRTLGEEN
ncbi:MAG: hypothetical protein GC152_07305 [Alphaproteobacteria bacterium]|nr:hypothetical protein [Alphaproteobacteria bacterium]